MIMSESRTYPLGTTIFEKHRWCQGIDELWYPHETVSVVIYPCPNLDLDLLVNGGPVRNVV